MNENANENNHTRTLEEMKKSRAKYFENRLKIESEKEKSQQATVEQVEYFQKIKQLNAEKENYALDALLRCVKTKKTHSPILPYCVPVENAVLLLKSIMQERIKTTGKSLNFENEKILVELVKYFTGNESKLNRHKGIYLYGAVGRGKTIIMQSLAQMCLIIESKLENAGKEFTQRKFKVVNSKSIIAEFAETKKHETLKRYYSNSLCIDDFGAEENFKMWGNEMNVIGDIIEERYQRYQYSGLLTHATSNIPPEDWREKYGDRVDSRMNELFNPVLLVGIDKRKI